MYARQANGVHALDATGSMPKIRRNTLLAYSFRLELAAASLNGHFRSSFVSALEAAEDCQYESLSDE